jgi:hypothetical protein
MTVRKAVIPLLVVAAAFLLVAPVAGADSTEMPACLGCHSRENLTLKFADGSSLSAYVDKKALAASAHGSLDCSDCHEGYTAESHPRTMYRSKKLFQLRLSRICRGCHTDKEICKKAVHESLLGREKQGSAPVCTDCHAAHSVALVAGSRLFASEERYCMGCHSYETTMYFKDGKKRALTVDLEGLKDSAHGNLNCSDCHFGFSSEDHPTRNFRTEREYAIAAADVCRRCHFDKYTKILESIHYSVLSQGNLMAPTCNDCHGSHNIERISAETAATSARQCSRCHRGIYEIYATSVHGDALLSQGNTDVPACIHCHKPHEIDDPLTTEYHEKIPEMCSNCHSNEAVVGKYGLSTDVVKTYLSDFHGVTLGFYKMQKEDAVSPSRPIAVCTDCHGTHNIMSTVGPGSAEVKATLLKRCQKCHAGATENFPDTWLSHYVPSLEKSPAIFFVNSIYGVLMPIMVVGLLLQVLLHVWRYIANR